MRSLDLSNAATGIALVATLTLAVGATWLGLGEARTDDRAAVTGQNAAEARQRAGDAPARPPMAEPPGAAATSPKAAYAGRPFIGKPRPPVEVRLAATPQLDSGVPGRLTLEVRSGVAVEDLELRLEGDEGLELVGSATHRLRRLAAGQATRLEVAVTPTSGGSRRLSGFLAFTVAGQAQGVPVTLALPVRGPDRIGAVSAKPQTAAGIDAQGELVYSMAAETRVEER